jgi:hypothetical protein
MYMHCVDNDTYCYLKGDDDKNSYQLESIYILLNVSGPCVYESFKCLSESLSKRA